MKRIRILINNKLKINKIKISKNTLNYNKNKIIIFYKILLNLMLNFMNYK